MARREGCARLCMAERSGAGHPNSSYRICPNSQVINESTFTKILRDCTHFMSLWVKQEKYRYHPRVDMLLLYLPNDVDDERDLHYQTISSQKSLYCSALPSCVLLKCNVRQQHREQLRQAGLANFS